MLVRWFWRDCDFQDDQWGAEPKDSFWVEATLDEAEAVIFPRLKAEAVQKSLWLGEHYGEFAKQVSQPPRPFCFLVTRDLRAITPENVGYPFHHMWGAYSPFRTMPPVEISRLEEVADLILPDKIDDDDDVTCGNPN
jgi:hypothetical protein